MFWIITNVIYIYLLEMWIIERNLSVGIKICLSITRLADDGTNMYTSLFHAVFPDESIWNLSERRTLTSFLRCCCSRTVNERNMYIYIYSSYSNASYIKHRIDIVYYQCKEFLNIVWVHYTLYNIQLALPSVQYNVPCIVC